MASGGNGQPAGRRRLFLLAALVGWVVVILVAAGREPDDPPLIGVENLDAVLLVGVLLAAAAGLALLIILNPFQSEWTEPGRRPGSYGYMLLLLGALALLFWQPSLLDDLLEEQQEDDGSEDEALAELLAERENQEPPETVAQATEILALVVIAGGIVGAVFLFRGRTKPPPPVATDEDFEAELIVAMDEAQLELRDDGDPRIAVLSAYRTLEVVLESRGNHRSRSETTTEHITRSMRLLAIDPTPVVQLGELYQIARFSDREITVGQRDAARTALERAVADLRRQT